MRSIDQAAVTQLAPGGRHHHLGRAERIRENTHPLPATRVKTHNTHKLPLYPSIYTLQPETQLCIINYRLKIEHLFKNITEKLPAIASSKVPFAKTKRQHHLL